MKKQYFLNAAIIDPKNSLDEMGGLIVSEEGKIEAVGKKVNKNNIPSREKFLEDPVWLQLHHHSSYHSVIIRCLLHAALLNNPGQMRISLF